MDQEERDEELRWRLEVLRTKFAEGKIFIAKEVAEGLEQSLMAVRTGADGKIDLTTVDGRVRSMALAVAAMDNRERTKNAMSLEYITNSYFEFIERNLGFFVKAAKDAGADAHEFGRMISSHPLNVEEYSPQIPKFLEALEEFWGAAADPSHYHIQDLQSTKAIYGGDLFPSYQRNIASSTGLYIDTIVLSDPFWHSRHVFERSSPDVQLYYLAKHAINLMGYRDLATAKLDAPIVVVTPFRSSVDESEVEFLRNVSQRDGVTHAEKLFGRKFSGIEELYEFCNVLDTPEKAAAQISDTDRVLFDTDWTGSIEEQISRSMQRDGHLLPEGSGPGQVLAAQSVGRMMQATDLLLKSRYLGGTPLLDAPTSWRYFNWKLEYNSSIALDNTHLHMVKGLQRAAETDMEWLGNIPAPALIEMRQQGAFHEIREVLSAGVGEIAETKPEAFFRSSDKIVENIQVAFEHHQKNVKELRNKGLKFAGYDLGTWISVGAVEIAAIATGTPLFGAAAFAANQILDVPKLKDIPARFMDLKNAHKELKKSPVGLLFAHKA
ncbi:hypothetical protein [Rhizobium sp.]|uniref:hypothetical protein n=1 Tax=Rhizobium sp. TaxID=391 RepID=UPI0028AC24C4